MPNKTKNRGDSYPHKMPVHFMLLHMSCEEYSEKWRRLIKILTAATNSEQMNPIEDFCVTNGYLFLLANLCLYKWAESKKTERS